MSKPPPLPLTGTVPLEDRYERDEVTQLQAEIERLRGHLAHRDKEIARLDELVVRLRAEIELVSK